MLGWFNSKQYPEFKWDRIVWIPLVWVGQCFMNSNVTWVVISQIILYPSNNIWSIPGEEGRQEFSRLLQVLGEQGWLAMVASCSQTCDRLSVHPNLSLMWCCWNLVSKVCIFFANHWVSTCFKWPMNHRVLRCVSMSSPAPLRTGMLLDLPGPYDPCVQTMSPLIHSNVDANLLCKICRGCQSKVYQDRHSTHLCDSRLWEGWFGILPSFPRSKMWDLGAWKIWGSTRTCLGEFQSVVRSKQKIYDHPGIQQKRTENNLAARSMS